MCCTVSNKVILAAVVGSLSCGLLLVIALGVTYRLVCPPAGRRSSRHVSPITAIEEQIYARHSAPPPYPEAMATSRPYEDYQREIVAAGRSDPAGTADTTDCNHDTGHRCNKVFYAFLFFSHFLRSYFFIFSTFFIH